MSPTATPATPTPPAAMLAPLIDLLEGGLRSLPLPATPERLYGPIEYVLALGGKRFRPLLLLLAGQAHGARHDDLLEAALAIEIFHNFTLVHDDIMDRAPLRRGKPTVHERWDMPVAILSGDAMLVVAYERLRAAVPTSAPAGLLSELMGMFSRAALDVVEGQQYDMDFEQRHDGVGRAEYLEMIRLKTAALVGVSLAIGARLAGASPEAARALDEAGQQLGIGFQLMDDYLDLYGNPDQVGKTPGGDVLAGKKTFLITHALEQLPDGSPERARLLTDYRQPALPGTLEATQKLSTITDVLDRTGAGDACRALAGTYYATGLEALRTHLPDTPARAALIDIMAAQIQRSK